MNVTDSNSDGNPNSPISQTPEQLRLQIDRFADELKAKAREAASCGDSFDSVERDV